jgi:integrase
MDATLSGLFREYECFKQVKAVTKDKARAAFAHLATFAGDIPAAELSPAMVNRWATWLATKAPVRQRPDRPGLAAHTVKTTIGAAAQVFGWALRQKAADRSNEYGLTVNPFAEAEPVKVDERAVRWYSEEEARDILAAAAEVSWREPSKTFAWYAAILTALQCGLRKNEITNLRWEDIDLDVGRIQIRHRTDCPGEYWQWMSKGKHEGNVPMSDHLWGTMCRLRELRPWRYPFLPRRRYEALIGRRWPLPEKVRDNPAHNWRRDFQRILSRANAKRQADGRQGIQAGDFHQLRKTAGTWLAESGLPVHYVQATLRHASAETTRKYYVGVNHRDCEARVREAMNGLNL